jgi:hypothetical protein
MPVPMNLKWLLQRATATFNGLSQDRHLNGTFLDNGAYRGITKSLRWEAVEDLRIHRIHLFMTQEEVNKSSK